MREGRGRERFNSINLRAGATRRSFDLIVNTRWCIDNFFAKYWSLDEICMNSIENRPAGDPIKFIYRRWINFTKFDYDMLGDQKGNNRFLDRSRVIVSSLKRARTYIQYYRNKCEKSSPFPHRISVLILNYAKEFNNTWYLRVNPQCDNKILVLFRWKSNSVRLSRSRHILRNNIPDFFFHHFYHHVK